MIYIGCEDNLTCSPNIKLSLFSLAMCLFLSLGMYGRENIPWNIFDRENTLWKKFALHKIYCDKYYIN